MSGASVLALLCLDPCAAALLLAALGSAALLLIGGGMVALPPPPGAGQLPWAILATSLAASQPALGLAALSRTSSGAADELRSLQLLTPPLLRSMGCAAVALAPLPLLAPVPYVRALAALLLAAAGLGTLLAVATLPLLHVLARQPPPPPPPTERGEGGRAGGVGTSLLRAARGAPSYHTGGSVV